MSRVEFSSSATRAFGSGSSFSTTAFGSGSGSRAGAFSPSAAKAFGSSSSSYDAERADGSGSGSGSGSGAFSYGAFASRSRSRPVAYGSDSGFGSRATPAVKKEPVVVATSFTDFPSLKKAPPAAAPASKPVMNFKAVAEAAASKPAPPPPSLASAKAKTESGHPSYYQGDWAEYEDEEDVDLEITDEDGGLNSRRAGDKSNW